MPAPVYTDERLRNGRHIFLDRMDAGERLGEYIAYNLDSPDAILGIPIGGIPVAYASSKVLQVPFSHYVVTKIPSHLTPEIGIGAVAPDGTVFLNEHLVSAFALSREQLEGLVQKALARAAQLDSQLSKARPPQQPAGRHILLVDDGLASGYTMYTAAQLARRQGAKTIGIGVPTGNTQAIESLREVADYIVCLNIRDETPFAVADAYMVWYDLTLSEALKFLQLE